MLKQPSPHEEEAQPQLGKEGTGKTAKKKRASSKAKAKPCATDLSKETDTYIADATASIEYSIKEYIEADLNTDLIQELLLDHIILFCEGEHEYPTVDAVTARLAGAQLNEDVEKTFWTNDYEKARTHVQKILRTVHKAAGARLVKKVLDDGATPSDALADVDGGDELFTPESTRASRNDAVKSPSPTLRQLLSVSKTPKAAEMLKVYLTENPIKILHCPSLTQSSTTFSFKLNTWKQKINRQHAAFNKVVAQLSLVLEQFFDADVNDIANHPELHFMKHHESSDVLVTAIVDFVGKRVQAVIPAPFLIKLAHAMQSALNAGHTLATMAPNPVLGELVLNFTCARDVQALLLVPTTYLLMGIDSLPEILNELEVLPLSPDATALLAKNKLFFVKVANVARCLLLRQGHVK